MLILQNYYRVKVLKLLNRGQIGENFIKNLIPKQNKEKYPILKLKILAVIWVIPQFFPQ